MSILIKGMEMPTSCENCELAKHFDGYNENDCPFNAFSFYDCPLVLVPPHGRLIDADAIEHGGWIASRIYQASPTERVYETKHMNEFPTIIEADGEK